MGQQATLSAEATRRASRGFAGAGWLLLAFVACADGDSAPAYSYPFDPEADGPSVTPVNTITTVNPNQPGDGVNDGADTDADGLGDVNAPGGAGGGIGVGGIGGIGGVGGVGGMAGVGGAPGMSSGGEGGFYGFEPEDPDTAGSGGGGLGGLGGSGGAADGLP